MQGLKVIETRSVNSVNVELVASNEMEQCRKDDAHVEKLVGGKLGLTQHAVDYNVVERAGPEPLWNAAHVERRAEEVGHCHRDEVPEAVLVEGI